MFNRCVLVSYCCNEFSGLNNTGFLFQSSAGQKSKLALDWAKMKVLAGLHPYMKVPGQ